MFSDTLTCVHERAWGVRIPKIDHGAACAHYFVANAGHQALH